MLLLRISKSNLKSSLFVVDLIFWFKDLFSSINPDKVFLRLLIFVLFVEAETDAIGDLIVLDYYSLIGLVVGDCSEIHGIPLFTTYFC